MVAENFHTIFGRGSDKQISGPDVEMALWLAVQELSKGNERLTNENAAQQAQIDALKAENAEVKARVDALEAKGG